MLRKSNHCPNITHIFNDTFLHLHLIRQIKSFYLPFQNSSPPLFCFYDKGFFCLCTDFYGQLQANCFEFDHDLVSIQYQSIIVLVSLVFTVMITVMGLVDGVLSLIIFISKELRKTGYRLYLIGSSITTLLISLTFCKKFYILPAAQMTYMTNKSFLSFQCRSLDFVLRTSLFMDQ